MLFVIDVAVAFAQCERTLIQQFFTTCSLIYTLQYSSYSRSTEVVTSKIWSTSEQGHVEGHMSTKITMATNRILLDSTNFLKRILRATYWPPVSVFATVCWFFSRIKTIICRIFTWYSTIPAVFCSIELLTFKKRNSSRTLFDSRFCLML